MLKFKVGKSVSLRDIRMLAADLDQSTNATTRLLRALDVPILAIHQQRVYNEYTLEQALFAITSFGAEGLAAPASSARKKGASSGMPTMVPKSFATSEIAKRALKAQKQVLDIRRADNAALIKGLRLRDPLT